MELARDCHVLDIGSGLGGAARTVAETFDCSVTGIDLTRSFCDAAATISSWLGLSDKVRFVHGDATDLPFDPACFDAAMTIHAAMNIPAKDALYAGAKRALKSGGIFAVYDVLQGEGGPLIFPVPWARDASISHLATPSEMRRLLAGAGFEILEEIDSSDASLAWFQAMTERMAKAGPPPVTFQSFLGADFPQMARNQIRNLSERRIRTVSYFCRA
jgi:ubiquinone/menaquinone biosynthesis C-methylase UbiE